MTIPGMDCVLEVLRDEANRREVALTEWHDAFRVAEEEHILPFFMAKLRQSGLALPDPIQDELSRAEKEANQNAFWWASELRGILQAFAAEGIAVIPLKGPMLAERIYGSIKLRQARDLDLLVRPQDIAAALCTLKKLGFSVEPTRGGYDYKCHRGSTLVELHFDVAFPTDFNFDPAAAWGRARPRHFLGQPVWEFAPSDELLYLCVHGAKHRFESLKQILDVAHALKSLGKEIDPKVYELGPVARLRPLILLGCALAMRLDARFNPGTLVSVNAKTNAFIEKLADTRWSALLLRPGPSSRRDALPCFHLEIEAAPLDRLARLARLTYFYATLLRQEDFDLAARFGIHRPGLVYAFRPFRVLVRLCGSFLTSGIRTSALKKP